jgi:hypothetical protein
MMKLGFAFLTLIGASVALFLLSPAVAIAACPSCFGFASVGSNIYVENSMAAEERTVDEAIINEAREHVSRFYGHLTGSPRILLCATQKCYDRIGGGSKGTAVLDVAVFLSPRGMNPVIATHELSHIELHSRLGLIRTYGRAIPQWFDEGNAVIVSGDPRYLRPVGDGDRCRIESDETLPTSRAAWVEKAESADLYAKAACRVSRWIISHGGPAAVVRLLAAVANGQSFVDAAR